VGSVFSPYYAWARALRRQADPENFVSLNVALYTPGRTYWCMTERGRARLARDCGNFQVGRSLLHWTGDRLVIDIDEVTVPIPRRVRGRITLHPRALTDDPFALDAGFRHAWWPLAPSADVHVALDQPGWTWSGHGYMDRNWGMEPLENAFAHWSWSRTAFGPDTLLLYDSQPRTGAARTLSLRADATGLVQPVEPPPQVDLPKTGWGLSRRTRAQTTARLIRGLEDGPFYARASVETTWEGRRGIGMHEALSLDRFRNPVVQAMLPFRMPRRSG
jgi:carotenoid 1,2-hydratase